MPQFLVTIPDDDPRAAATSEALSAAIREIAQRDDTAPIWHDPFALDLARNRMRADYWADVRGVVEDICQAIKDGEITDSESLHDWLHETIDGHGRVIYTGRAIEGLLASDNDSVAFEDGLVDPSTWTDGIEWSQLMSSAMKRDVIAQLEAEDIDPNDPCPEPDEIEIPD